MRVPALYIAALYVFCVAACSDDENSSNGMAADMMIDMPNASVPDMLAQEDSPADLDMGEQDDGGSVAQVDMADAGGASGYALSEPGACTETFSGGTKEYSFYGSDPANDSTCVVVRITTEPGQGPGAGLELPSGWALLDARSFESPCSLALITKQNPTQADGVTGSVAGNLDADPPSQVTFSLTIDTPRGAIAPRLTLEGTVQSESCPGLDG